jgi:pimeloyl-ACP methyl ester carboxylesterase
LLRQLGIREVVAISHALGSPFALRFARLHPRMVTRLVGISRTPAWRDEWLAQLPQRQRFMLRLSRHAPQLLPLVAWAMLAVMESSRANDFVVYNCRDGDADRRAAENQETVDLIARGSVDAVRSSFEGLIGEIELVLHDFTEEAKASPHKFHMVHGADDKIIDPAQTLAFAREVRGTTVEIVEDAGQLLFYSHWQKVLDAIVPNRASAHRVA